MLTEEKCPRCGYVTNRHRNPVPTVDVIIEYQDQGLVLIERANPPPGWALPGGFVDYGESLEAAAIPRSPGGNGTHGDPIGAVVTRIRTPGATPGSTTSPPFTWPRALAPRRPHDDARHVAIFAPEQLPTVLAFDHRLILSEYLKVRPQWLALIKKISEI